MATVSKPKEKEYGIADRAWQPIVGCDPHMPCAPRCWARKTVARIVECQKPTSPERAEFFKIALTPDGKQWSGQTFLDEKHLLDPLKWRKPSVIATGFHGDWGRLSNGDKDRMGAVMGVCEQHTFLPLTKQPADLVAWCVELERVATEWRPRTKTGKFSPADVLNLRWLHATFNRGQAFPYREWPFRNVTLGCSVMNQAEADRMREPMAQLAAVGWATHVWYEPATGPVDWRGWEFLVGVIAGGESGLKSRPPEAKWFRATRDWCVRNGIPFNFKQWGDWLPAMEDGPVIDGVQVLNATDDPQPVGKKNAGRLLDGREWNELPRLSPASPPDGGSQPNIQSSEVHP